MKYETERAIMNAVNNAVHEGVEAISKEYQELLEFKRSYVWIKRDLEKTQSILKQCDWFLMNYRTFLSRIELSPFDTIEKIEHSEQHVNEYWEWWWFFEMWYKVITKWEEDEIFILEHWDL